MLVEDKQVIPASRAEVWDFLMQIEKVGECIPGCERVEEVGPDTYETTMRVNVGPIKLRVEAVLTVVARDRENWTATMKSDGTERGVGGGVHAMITMTLLEAADGATELVVLTDAKILGRLGEFGQPVMKKKAAAITEQFARALSERLIEERAGAAASSG